MSVQPTHPNGQMEEEEPGGVTWGGEYRKDLLTLMDLSIR